MRFLVAFLLTLTVPVAATAQASRAARVLTLLSGDSIGVLVSRDHVFIVDSGISPLSVCTARQCAPVRMSDACTVPYCPGTGVLLTLESPIADVSELPTDRDGFERALTAMRTDPQLSGIAWAFGIHPDSQSSYESSIPASAEPRWLTRSSIGHLGWEIGALGLGGVIGSSGVGFAGAEVSGGFRFTWDPRGDEDMLGMLFGDVLGLDLRVRVLDLMPVQGASSWAATIGIAPGVGYANDHELFRLPTLYSVIIPEIGMALRDTSNPAWYMGWSLPFTFLLEEHVGFEARASVLVIDDWIPGDDVEAIVTFGLGLVGR